METEDLIEQRNTLKELNLELKKNNKLLEEKMQHEQQLHNKTPIHTFAEILTKQKRTEIKNIEDIIVKVNNSDTSIQKVQCTIKEALGKTKKQINKVLTVKDKIIVKCENKCDVEEVQKIIEDSSESEVTVEIEKRKCPRIKIVGIDDLSKHSLSEIESDIRIRNTLQEDDKINVVHKYQNKKNNLWSVIAEVNANTYEKFMAMKKVFVGYTSCKIYDDFNINICYKCCSYGHSKIKCKWDLKCKFCSGEHEEKDCDQKDNLKCCNCSKSNEKNKTNWQTNHTADNKEMCEYYKQLLRRTINKYDYPYNPLTKQ